jgi:hypothetical protein
MIAFNVCHKSGRVVCGVEAGVVLVVLVVVVEEVGVVG